MLRAHCAYAPLKLTAPLLMDPLHGDASLFSAACTQRCIRSAVREHRVAAPLCYTPATNRAATPRHADLAAPADREQRAASSNAPASCHARSMHRVMPPSPPRRADSSSGVVATAAKPWGSTPDGPRRGAASTRKNPAAPRALRVRPRATRHRGDPPAGNQPPPPDADGRSEQQTGKTARRGGSRRRGGMSAKGSERRHRVAADRAGAPTILAAAKAG